MYIWIPLNSLSPKPTDRYTMAAYDSNRQRLVVFGGHTDSYLNDTWEFDGYSWEQKSPTSTPSSRAYGALVFDSARSVCVLFGGLDNNGYLSETWEYDGLDWVQKNPAQSPSVRTDFGMAFDANRGVTVLFGGQNASGIIGETWEYDGVNWSQASPTQSPVARSLLAMAYHPVKQKIFLFGGGNGLGDYLNDTWEYDGANWVNSDPVASPPATSGSFMVYDSDRKRLLLVGGFTNGSFLRTWDYDGAKWSQLELSNFNDPTNEVPNDYQYVGGYLPNTKKTVIIGNNTPATSSSTWMLIPNAKIKTIAGSGTYGFSGDGGNATASNLGDPRGIVKDSLGNLYFCDVDNHRIRKLYLENGVLKINTIAGNGTQGTSGDGGPAIQASLNMPFSLAIDTQNRIYFSQYDYVIRRLFDENGTLKIETIAGSPNEWQFAGDNGELASTARFSFYGFGDIAINKTTGDLFVADEGWNRIRKIYDEGGVLKIRTVAGDGNQGVGTATGVASAISLNTPHNIALSPVNGDIFYFEKNYDGKKFLKRLFLDEGIYNIEIVAGAGDNATWGGAWYAGELEGRLASELNFSDYNDTAITIDEAGRIFLANFGYERLIRLDIDTNGNYRIRSLARAGGGFDDSSDALLAGMAANPPRGYGIICLGPNLLCISDSGGSGPGNSNRIREIYFESEVLSVSPAAVSPNSSTNLSLFGKGFTEATEAILGGVALTDFIVSSDTQSTATLSQGALTVGEYDLLVRSPFNAESSIKSKVSVSLFVPIIDNINPTEWQNYENKNITITGQRFINVSSVKLGNTELIYQVNSSTEIIVTIPAGHQPGIYDFFIQNTDGVNSSSPDYTVLDGSPLPVSIDPTSANNNINTTISIIGSNFTGSSSIQGRIGASIIDLAFNVINNSLASATIPAALPPGTYDIIMTNLAGSNFIGGALTVIEMRPFVASLSSKFANNNLVTAIVITGSHFTGASKIVFGTQNISSGIVVDNDSQITFSVPIGLVPGLYDLDVVTITNEIESHSVSTLPFAVLDGITVSDISVGGSADVQCMRIYGLTSIKNKCIIAGANNSVYVLDDVDGTLKLKRITLTSRGSGQAIDTWEELNSNVELPSSHGNAKEGASRLHFNFATNQLFVSAPPPPVSLNSNVMHRFSNDFSSTVFCYVNSTKRPPNGVDIRKNSNASWPIVYCQSAFSIHGAYLDDASGDGGFYAGWFHYTNPGNTDINDIFFDSENNQLLFCVGNSIHNLSGGSINLSFAPQSVVRKSGLIYTVNPDTGELVSVTSDGTVTVIKNVVNGPSGRLTITSSGTIVYANHGNSFIEVFTLNSAAKDLSINAIPVITSGWNVSVPNTMLSTQAITGYNFSGLIQPGGVHRQGISPANENNIQIDSLTETSINIRILNGLEPGNYELIVTNKIGSSS